MNILFITFIHPIYNGRVQRTCNSLRKISNLSTILPYEKSIHILETESTLVKKSESSGLIGYFHNIYKYIIVIKKTLNSNNYSFIYFSDYYTAILYRLLYPRIKKSKIKVIYDAYELYIPERHSILSFRFWFFYYFERSIILNASHVLSANQQRSILMQKHYRLNETPTAIHNFGYYDGYIPQRRIHEGAIRVIYIGNLSHERKLLELIELFENKGGEFKLTIAGSGILEQKIINMITSMGTKHTNFIGRYDQNELSSILSFHDVGYLFYPNNSLNNRLCSPLKLFDYLVNGIPVISFFNETLEKIYNEYGIGVSANDIVKGLRMIKSNYRFYTSNINRFLIENNWQKEEVKLLNVFSGLKNRYGADPNEVD
jgi:hypothetical protein